MASRSLGTNRSGISVLKSPSGTAVTAGLLQLTRSMHDAGRRVKRTLRRNRRTLTQYDAVPESEDQKKTTETDDIETGTALTTITEQQQQQQQPTYNDAEYGDGDADNEEEEDDEDDDLEWDDWGDDDFEEDDDINDGGDEDKEEEEEDGDHNTPSSSSVMPKTGEDSMNEEDGWAQHRSEIIVEQQVDSELESGVERGSKRADGGVLTKPSTTTTSTTTTSTFSSSALADAQPLSAIVTSPPSTPLSLTLTPSHFGKTSNRASSRRGMVVETSIVGLEELKEQGKQMPTTPSQLTTATTTTTTTTTRPPPPLPTSLLTPRTNVSNFPNYNHPMGGLKRGGSAPPSSAATFSNLLAEPSPASASAGASTLGPTTIKTIPRSVSFAPLATVFGSVDDQAALSSKPLPTESDASIHDVKMSISTDTEEAFSPIASPSPAGTSRSVRKGVSRSASSKSGSRGASTHSGGHTSTSNSGSSSSSSSIHDTTNTRTTSNSSTTTNSKAFYLLSIASKIWKRLGKTEYGKELQSLLPLSLPVMIQSTLGQLLNIVDLFFVGTFLGPEFLAAAALGNMYFNLLAALYMGAASAVDESCSHAYAAKKYQSVHVLALRGIVVMGAMAVIVMIGLSGTAPFLISLLKQEKDLSITAAGFVDALLLGILPHVVCIGLSRYLWAQGIVWAPILVDALANIVNVSLNAALIEVDGFLGAPLATSLSRLMQLAMLVFYMWKWEPHTKQEQQEQIQENINPTSHQHTNASKTQANSGKKNHTNSASMTPSVNDKPQLSSSSTVVTAVVSSTIITPEEALLVNKPVSTIVSSTTSSSSSTSSLSSSSSCLSMPLKEALGDGPGVLTMTKAALLGSFICVVESWPVEFSNAIAGRIDVPSLDAHTVILNTCMFISLGLPLGLSVAASARIPYLLQLKDVVGAQRTAKVALLATVAYNLMCACLLLAGRWRMGYVFTTNSEVAEQCAAVAAVAAVFQLVDGLQTTLGGILRGLGYSRGVIIVQFIGWACIGLPVASALSLGGWAIGADNEGGGGASDSSSSSSYGTSANAGGLGTSGLWAGLLCGIGAISVAHMSVYLTLDWEKAMERIVSATALEAEEAKSTEEHS